MRLELEDLTEEQAETVRAFAHAVRTGSKEGIEYRNVGKGDWEPSEGNRFLAQPLYRLKPETTSEDYLKAHQESGLKIGDQVRVLRSAEEGENGWPHFWADGQDTLIGKVTGIFKDRGEKGFLSDCGFYLPYFVLEKVETKYRTWTPEEGVGQRFRWVNDSIRTIDSWANGKFLSGALAFTPETLLEKATQVDGSRCGVPIVNVTHTAENQ